MPIATINPTNGEILKEFEPLSSPEIRAKIALGYSTYHAALSDPGTRTRRKAMLEKVASILEKEAESFGKLMATEMGKTARSGRDEALKCAWVCRYYAENCERFLNSEKIELGKGSRAEIQYQPLGVVLAVMPWNFPFWQVFRCAAPILLSGNSLLLKHASNVPQCAQTIEEIFRQAGLDEGAFQTLLIDSSQVSEVIADPQILGVTLTGSEPAGSKVAEQCGRLIKKTVLELGGSDPFIVMPSADLEKAVDVGVKARLLSNGQSCIAAKRFLVHESIYRKFRDLFLEKMVKLRIGNPLEDTTDLGPLATDAIRDELHSLVADAVDQGATLLLGGKIPAGHGFFYPPTVLEEVPMGAKIYQEEAFGPVTCLYEVRNIQDAIEIANATRFGLGASVWTKDSDEMALFAREIISGQVFFNTLVASDPRLPFGGTKSSGYGRELSEVGAREFCNIKTVVFSEA